MTFLETCYSGDIVTDNIEAASTCCCMLCSCRLQPRVLNFGPNHAAVCSIEHRLEPVSSAM